MALYEENLYEDLADEAEGAADAFDDGFEEYDEFDEADEADEFEELEAADVDAIDEFDEGDAAEEMEAADLGDEDIDAYEDVDSLEGDEEAFEAAMAYALAAEDTDEFFRRVRRFVRQAAPIVGRIARAAAPILRVIPHPVAQGAATAANLLGRLRFEGASEDEALEAMAELAARNPRVIPVVAGLAARTLVRRAGATMPTAASMRCTGNGGSPYRRSCACSAPADFVSWICGRSGRSIRARGFTSSRVDYEHGHEGGACTPRNGGRQRIVAAAPAFRPRRHERPLFDRRSSLRRHPGSHMDVRALSRPQRREAPRGGLCAARGRAPCAD